MKIDHLEGESVHRELEKKKIPFYFIKILHQFCFCLLILPTKGHPSLILYALVQNK